MGLDAINARIHGYANYTFDDYEKSTKGKEGLVSEKGLLMSENGRIEYYKKNINLPTYMLGNIIYILSLNLLSFISYVFQMPSHNAFKIRKRIVPRLFFEGFIHKIKH